MTALKNSLRKKRLSLLMTTGFMKTEKKSLKFTVKKTWSFESIAVCVVNLLRAWFRRNKWKFIELRKTLKDLWLYLMHAEWISLPAVDIRTVF